MKNKEFQAAVKNIPVFVALFKAIKVYPYMKKYGVKVGDLFVVGQGNSAPEGSLSRHIQKDQPMYITEQSVEFLGYATKADADAIAFSVKAGMPADVIDDMVRLAVAGDEEAADA